MPYTAPSTDALHQVSSCNLMPSKGPRSTYSYVFFYLIYHSFFRHWKKISSPNFNKFKAKDYLHSNKLFKLRPLNILSNLVIPIYLYICELIWYFTRTYIMLIALLSRRGPSPLHGWAAGSKSAPWMSAPPWMSRWRISGIILTSHPTCFHSNIFIYISIQFGRIFFIFEEIENRNWEFSLQRIRIQIRSVLRPNLIPKRLV